MKVKNMITTKKLLEQSVEWVKLESYLGYVIEDDMLIQKITNEDRRAKIQTKLNDVCYQIDEILQNLQKEELFEVALLAEKGAVRFGRDENVSTNEDVRMKMLACNALFYRVVEIMADMLVEKAKGVLKLSQLYRKYQTSNLKRQKKLVLQNVKGILSQCSPTMLHVLDSDLTVRKLNKQIGAASAELLRSWIHEEASKRNAPISYKK